jgi:hypothetical protein
MAKCTHPPRAAGPWSPCASALMPGFVLKRSCGGFVEFVPPQGRKMLALLAGLAEIAGGAGCSSPDPERAFMEHGVPLQAAALRLRCRCWKWTRRGSPCSAGGRAAMLSVLPHATQTSQRWRRAMTELMCQRRTARSAGELDVLLLMLCIQCKKMYTVWVVQGDGGRHVQDRGGCLCEAQGLLLCADNDDVEGFWCSKQSIRRRPNSNLLFVGGPICVRMNEVAERMRDMPTRSSAACSASCRSWTCLCSSSPEGSGGSLLCETAWLPSSAAAGCSSGQLRVRQALDGRVPNSCRCARNRFWHAAALLRVQHPPPAPR